MEVALEGVELRLVHMPLVEPFVTAHGTRRRREIVLVRALVADGPDGWGECVAEPEPTYWPEYTAAALHVLEHHLVPRLLDGRSLRQVQGHNMAKAALECAALDAGLRAESRSMASFLGATARRDGYFEGRGYQVTWALGHLATLKEPQDYDPALKRWSLASLPITISCSCASLARM